MFRWSTAVSKIFIKDYGGAWCTLKISGGGYIQPNFDILLNGTVKVCEGKAAPKAMEFSFYVPEDTEFLQVNTQGWRPCDFGKSVDRRTLGIGLSEVVFRGEILPDSIEKGYKASTFIDKYEDRLKNRSATEIISNAKELSEATSTAKEAASLIYGAMIYLLSRFAETKLSALDENGELKRMLLGIDIPYYDLDSEIIKEFEKHPGSFARSSMSNESRKCWKENVDFLSRNALDGWWLKSPNCEIVIYDDDVLFFFKEGHIYVNHPEANSWKMLYFDKLSDGCETRQVRELLYSARRAASSKEFYRLKALVESPWIPANADLRKQIRRFRRKYTNSEKYDYLMGKFFLRLKNYTRAQRYVFIGLRRRRLDYHLCALMGDICKAIGDYVHAAEYYGRMMAKMAERERHWMMLGNNELNADDYTKERIVELFRAASGKSPNLLAECTEAVGNVIITERAKYGDHQKLVYDDGKFSIVNIKDGEIHGVKSNGNIFYRGNQIYGNLFWPGEIVKEYCGEVTNDTIVPIMNLSKDNVMTIRYHGNIVHYDGKKSVNRFRVNNWQFLRLNENIEIKSDKEIILGKPITLMPSFSRKKLVINLLIDALSMEEIQEDLSKFMPNTYRFFSKGTIFKHTYGLSDWTHPCTSSMFYGLELSRHQLFHSRINLKQPNEYKNVAEYLHEKGYFCINSFFDVERFLANDTYRGYDMHKSYGVNDGLAMMDAIHLLENIPANIFLNVHFMEVHQTNFNPHETWTLSVDTLDLPFEQVLKSDMFVTGNSDISSDEKREGRLNIYLHEIAQTDRKLGMLYDYLEKNYSDEEYMIVLHSDHGGGRTGLTTRHHSHTCLMVRGDGVPHKGIVDDEVVSALDWFAIFEHFCEFEPELPRDSRLPKAFGGPGREYAVTQRLYPKQTYAVSLNDLEYEFYMQTKKETSYDGKVNLSNAEFHLYKHENEAREEIFDDDLIKRYYSLAYNYAKYFDEPSDNNQGTLFDKLLINKRKERRPLISLVLDYRNEGKSNALIHSLGTQSFMDYELMVILGNGSAQRLRPQCSELIERNIKIVEKQATEDIVLPDILETLRGEYVLFLNGEEIFESRALEALYYTAKQHGSDVVENVCLLEGENNGVNDFPEDIYNNFIEPLDGSEPDLHTVKLDGRASTRHELLLNKGKRIHCGNFLVRKDFLAKLGNIAMYYYGFEELLALYLLLGANEYVRISVPTHACASKKSSSDLKVRLEALLKNMNEVDMLIKKLPYLTERSKWQDDIRARYFSFYEAHYLTQTSNEEIEEVATEVLQKYSSISSWLVKYLFVRTLSV